MLYLAPLHLIRAYLQGEVLPVDRFLFKSIYQIEKSTNRCFGGVVGGINDHGIINTAKRLERPLGNT